MKKKIFIFLAIVLTFYGFMFGFPALWLDEDTEKSTFLYDDLEPYINDNYEGLRTSNLFNKTAQMSKNYIPNYKDVVAADCLTGFYIYDGSDTSSINYCNISFVLEFEFENEETYNNFLFEEYQRIDYSNGITLTKNNYECDMTFDKNISTFLGDEKYPYIFGLLCKNKTNYIVRYVYFRYINYPKNYVYHNVFLCTNCEW